jgi:hypothetical protein
MRSRYEPGMHMVPIRSCDAFLQLLVQAKFYFLAAAFIFQVFLIENKGVIEILEIIVQIYLQGGNFFLLLHPASEGRGQQKRLARMI